MSWEQYADQGSGGGGGGYQKYIQTAQANRATRTADRERAEADYLQGREEIAQAAAEAEEAQAPLRAAQAAAGTEQAAQAAELSGVPPQEVAPTFYAGGVAPTTKGQGALLRELQAAKVAETKRYAERAQPQPEDQVVSEATEQIKRQNLEDF